MSIQRIAQVFGVVFVLVGLLGLLLCGVGMEECLLLGLFPVNLLHNLAHVLLGVWGLTAARSLPAATQYCKVAGVLYAVLTVLGFVTPDFFGLIPLGGHDRWLHLVLAAILLYFGFGGKPQAAAPAM